jgi:hypothetical protein
MEWGGSISSSNPMIAKILGQTVFLNKYKAYIEELINPTNHYFTFVDSTNRIRTWNSMIAGSVDNDIGEYTSINDYPVGSYAYYLLIGDDTQNYFRTRIKTACANLGLNYDLYKNAGLGGGGGITNTNSSDPLASDPSTYTTMYLVGTFNNWGYSGELPMTLLSNSIWSVTVSGISSGQEYKFMNTTSWDDADWGEGTYPNDGVAVLESPNNMTCNKSGTVKFYFNDNTYQYWTSY